MKKSEVFPIKKFRNFFFEKITGEENCFFLLFFDLDLSRQKVDNLSKTLLPPPKKNTIALPITHTPPNPQHTPPHLTSTEKYIYYRNFKFFYMELLLLKRSLGKISTKLASEARLPRWQAQRAAKAQSGG